MQFQAQYHLPQKRRLSFSPFRAAIMAYTTVFAALVLTGADTFFYLEGYLPIAPIRFFIVGSLPLVSMVLFTQLLQSKSSTSILALLRGNAMIVLPFSLVVIIGLLFSMHPTANWSEEGRWIKLVVFNGIVFFSALLFPLLKTIRSRFEHIVFGALILLLASVALDVISPGTLSKQSSRAAGFARNANFSSLLITYLTAFVIRFDGKTRFKDIMILAISGLAILMTLSRSGALGFGLLVSAYLYFTLKQRGLQPKKLLLFLLSSIVAISLLVFVLPIVIQNSEMFTTPGAKKRLAALSGERSLYSGDDARIRAANASLQLINDAPLLGHGSGYSYSMAIEPHNLYLQQWINNGLPGILALLLLLFCCFVTFRRRKYANGLCFMLLTLLGSFFSHGILDHRPFLVLLAMTTSISWLRTRSAQQWELENNSGC